MVSKSDSGAAYPAALSAVSSVARRFGENVSLTTSHLVCGHFVALPLPSTGKNAQKTEHRRHTPNSFSISFALDYNSKIYIYTTIRAS